MRELIIESLKSRFNSYEELVSETDDMRLGEKLVYAGLNPRLFAATSIYA